MIPQVLRGGDPSGLMTYLVGEGTRNEHEHPHLVAGSPDIMAWHSTGELSHPEALDIGSDLNQAHRVFGVDMGGRHVWHCPLSLHVRDGQLSDERWEQLATDFMSRMGHIGVEGKADTQWVAVRHGLSGESGNDHVHLVVSLIRNDGTKVDTWMDYQRAQDTARELEREYGLTQVAGDLSPRYDRTGAQEAAAGRGRVEPERVTLERVVRACSTASQTEDEFVRRLRGEGVLARASFRGEEVRGYSVALPPVRDEGPIYYSGSTIARDLGLGHLRGRWPSTPEDRLRADAEWTAATRGLRVVAPGREQEDPSFDGGRMAGVLSQWQERLASLHPDDREGWRAMSADLSGVFAHWSRATEPEPGPLAAVSKELSRSAQVSRREYRPAPQDAQLGVATSAMLTWLSTQDDPRAVLAVWKRMNALAGAIRAHQEARGDVVRKTGLEKVGRERLMGLDEAMHVKAGVTRPGRSAPAQPGPGASVLPPVMTRQNTKTGQEMTR